MQPEGSGGLATASRRRLNSSAVRFSPTGALWSMSYAVGYLNVNTFSTACGPISESFKQFLKGRVPSGFRVLSESGR